jgi:hypothetical protein
MNSNFLTIILLLLSLTEDLCAKSGSVSTKKLGEGTYSEVYRNGNTVFKVVPFGRENQKVYFIHVYCFPL